MRPEVSDPRLDARRACASLSEPSSECRIREFVQWDCVTLRHERERLAAVMVSGKAAFMSKGYQDAIRHDLTDIDYLLAEIDKRSVPGLEHSKE